MIWASVVVPGSMVGVRAQAPSRALATRARARARMLFSFVVGPRGGLGSRSSFIRRLSGYAARTRQVGGGVKQHAAVDHAAPAVDEVAAGAHDAALLEMDVEAGGDAGTVVRHIPG